MFDTVNIWLPMEQAGTKNLTANIAGALSDVTEHYRQDGTGYYSGYLDNYRVNVSPAGLNFKGSLSKYYSNNSLQTLTRLDTQRAIEKMQDETHLNLTDAKVNRFDVARTFSMKYEPTAYYPYLSSCNHYKRFEQPTGLYYSNGQRIKLFYDKVQELKKQNQNLPVEVDGSNCLRYELRYTNRLPMQFKRPITLSTLADEDFYNEVVNRWKSEYQTIQKRKIILFDNFNMRKPKEFHEQVERLGIKSVGLDNLLLSVDEMQLRGVFKNRNAYWRIKEELKELFNKPDLTVTSELIAELDAKVLEACDF